MFINPRDDETFIGLNIDPEKIKKIYRFTISGSKLKIHYKVINYPQARYISFDINENCAIEYYLLRQCVPIDPGQTEWVNGKVLKKMAKEIDIEDFINCCIYTQELAKLDSI